MRAYAGLVAASLAATGCFRYVPVNSGAVPADEEVRVRISEPAAVRVARELGTYTAHLEGQLSPHGRDSLAVAILIGRDYRGTALGNVRQTLALQRSEVVEVRRRQFSLKYTALTTVGVLSVFAILVHRLTQQENPNLPPDDRLPTPPPPGARTIVRLPFGWVP